MKLHSIIRVRPKVKRFLIPSGFAGFSEHARGCRDADAERRNDADHAVGGRGMAGQPPGPLSGLLPAENRTGPDQQVVGVARVPQHQRLHLVGHVHVVVGQREPG